MSLGAYLTASMTAIRCATTIDQREIQFAPGRKPDECHFQGQKVKVTGAGAYCGGLPHSLLSSRCSPSTQRRSTVLSRANTAATTMIRP